MPTLLRVNIDYADEFGTYGFMGFDTLAQAKHFVDEAVRLSEDNEEFVYFGTNECIGDFRDKEFVPEEITEEEFAALKKLFPVRPSTFPGNTQEKYEARFQYGIVTSILESMGDEYEDEDDGEDEAEDEDED